MKFNSTINKIKNTFFSVLNNEKNLDIKAKKDIALKSQAEASKVPKILYDSGWTDMGETVGNLTQLTASLVYPIDTALVGQITPFALSYSFKTDLNVTENQIPFIKSSVMIKKYPGVNIEGTTNFKAWDYGDNYWKIWGDSIKVYEGISPALRFFSETQRVNGEFLANNASKWHFGTLNYTIGADSYEMRNSYIVSVKTYYDVVELAGFPGWYSSKSFESPALDGVSSSAVSGEGTYTVITALESPPGVPGQTTVTTKNVQMSAPMFEDKTNLNVSGNLYKNGVFQQNYSDLSPLGIEFQGVLGGNATLVSFSYDWITRQQWKLFWSNLRATQFLFNTSSRVPTTFPDTSDYETATLPYTTITVEENPTGFPELEEDTIASYSASSQRDIWTKKNDNLFTLHNVATVYLSAPATYTTTTTKQFVDEDYIHSGSTYTRDAENRDPQEKPMYEPRADGMQIRFMISFNNPVSYNRSNNFKV